MVAPMGKAPEYTERTVVMLAPEMVDAIDNYRKGFERIPSRGEAIRQLIEEGLLAIQERARSKHDPDLPGL
jgi:metal-responsive CopG/Arc/MetJ family transcriptional regulator